MYFQILFLVGAKGLHTLTFKDQNKDGKTYWIVDKYNIVLPTDRTAFQFENLFTKDNGKADNIVHEMNKNWLDTVTGLLQPIVQFYNRACKDFANKIFSKVPVDQIFLN